MGERQVSSGRKAKSARAQRREAERREAAAVRRLEARARVLTYEPGELDQAVGQQPRLLDVALMSRYAARGRVFSGCRELLPPEGSLVLTLIPAADAVLCKAGAGWSVDPEVAESFDVGLAWSELSEWLHGRGLITAALGEIADAAGGTVPGALAG